MEWTGWIWIVELFFCSRTLCAGRVFQPSCQCPIVGGCACHDIFRYDLLRGRRAHYLFGSGTGHHS